ncbi:hypothetical protein BDY17DRAFT_297276 [Neohortaea acidophila]|uniref:PH domain-containing protein n=1 Tax=Neohortaea acidophila TaxID=245834 RepID=A0A6A6PUH2_9PEZI|nr:uncharacterized protein BDY17DRAFT_297276 [Neohortaea acidophila]KAF2483334.1 hypothetical protein BDY17DRAFT_297276 [Neohortaea acidophila]
MTALDIVQHASKHWPSRINSDSAVLLEYFISVGIQRPLRQFERMQDVMNSWTHDRQNYLILIDPGTGSAEAELTLAGIPSQLPRKQSWVLEYSQKVGKWDKRIVTLHPSGLITQAARNGNVDAARTKEIGYLSDCDIYVPTPAKVRGKIKPPRRFCFAVKSQQDMSCFGSLCDYVHFFCTHDRQTADTFYAAVQGWRSRYLVGGLREDVKGKRGDDVPREKEMPSKAKGVVVSTTQAPFTKSAGQFDTSLSPERRNVAMNFALSLNGGGGSRLRRLDLERADPRGGKVGRGVAM